MARRRQNKKGSKKKTNKIKDVAGNKDKEKLRADIRREHQSQVEIEMERLKDTCPVLCTDAEKKKEVTKCSNNPKKKDRDKNRFSTLDIDDEDL